MYVCTYRQTDTNTRIDAIHAHMCTQRDTESSVRSALTSDRPIFNKFSLKAGQWTDDCSMGLCIADSLLCKDGFNGADMRARFWNWWFRGYNNAFRFDGMSTGESCGLGCNIGGQPESDEGTRVRVRDRKRGHAADQIRSDAGLDAKTQSQIRSDTGLFFYR